MSLDNVPAGRNVPDEFNVIIEIPAHADPIKYEVDKETGAVFVDRFIGTSMHYPCNYGYVPKSLADDGDPLDVLVITPFPLQPGVVVRCRPLGVLKMEDEAGGDSNLLTVPIDNGVITTAAQPSPDPTLEPVLAKLGAYVAAYGEKVSLIVGVEKYTQSVMFDSATSPAQPRRLVAEFAIVKTSDNSGWVGFRDVVEVDGKALRDRRDRLLSLFTNTTADTSEAARIANESARFNVGPISRNFNTPTSALFFFLPEHHGRFRFTRKGTKKIDGVTTWELAFKETRSPTLVMTRAGKDVPLEGSLWVDPTAGTVLRTRLHMSNFAYTITSPVQKAPSIRPPVNPSVPQSGRALDTPSMYIQPIESEADIDVIYKLQPVQLERLPAREMILLVESVISGERGEAIQQVSRSK